MTNKVAVNVIMFVALTIACLNNAIVFGQTEQNTKGREPTKPEIGKYRANLDDGSMFDVTLVSKDGTLLIEKVGYHFVASKFEVSDLTTEDRQAFGKSTTTGLEFQFPLLLDLDLSKATITYYRGELKWDKLDTVACTLTRIGDPAKDLVDKFNFGHAIEVGSTTDTSKLKHLYEFLLKKVE